jgi:glucan-binding YG repeat protein
MIATNIWIFEDYGVFYLGEDGQKVSNCFVEDLNGLAYIDKNCYFSSEFSGTVYINDETFYVQNGYKVTDGWITLDNVEYFLIDGMIAKNQWIVDSFGKCYLDENGQKLSRTFVKDSNGWAYIEIDGYFYPSVSTWIYLQDS